VHLRADARFNSGGRARAKSKIYSRKLDVSRRLQADDPQESFISGRRKPVSRRNPRYPVAGESGVQHWSVSDRVPA